MRMVLEASLLLAGSALIALALAGTPGCNEACSTNLDCASGSSCTQGQCESQCSEDGECVDQGLGIRCNLATGRCLEAGAPGGSNMPEVIDDTWEGFLDEPVSGPTFVLNHLEIPASAIGIDVDDRCEGSLCVDNAFSVLGGYANDLIRSGVSSGESLIVIELAGLDRGFNGYDNQVTIKVYGALDADQRAINNFAVPPEETSCCSFHLDSQTLLANQAEARIRARIRDYEIVPVERRDVTFTLALGPPPHQRITLRRAQVKGSLIGNQVRGIRGGVLGGAVPMSHLAIVTANPFALPGETLESPGLSDRTVLDLVTALVSQPDIDLDGDGLECTLRRGGNPTIDACCDGAAGENACNVSGDACTSGVTIEPSAPDRPASCAEDTRIRDGYSAALVFDAVPANIVGVR